MHERTRDAWLSAGLLYVLLAAYTFTLYLGILALGGIRNDTQEVPLWLNAVSVPVIILTLLPVRAWLQSGVRAVVYGQHDNPYEVMTEIHQRFDADSAPAAMLPAIAQSIAASLRLPYVAIETDQGETTVSVATGKPAEGTGTVTIPLTYREARVGLLHTSNRRPGEPLSSADLKLLHDLARQVGIALHAAQLTSALQASRQQIVTAREEERRRIRRDLHDGLGPTLASLRLQLGALRRLMLRDPVAAEAIIDSLREDVVAATANIRRLVYELRPPMLDEFGLAGALRNLEHAPGGVPRTVDLPEQLPRLTAASEVALYRIASEALHNIERHASASRCSVQLQFSDQSVTLTVADDGAGFANQPLPGVGMSSMRERAEELGGTVTWTARPAGGTIVQAVLPR